MVQNEVLFCGYFGGIFERFGEFKLCGFHLKIQFKLNEKFFDKSRKLSNRDLIFNTIVVNCFYLFSNSYLQAVSGTLVADLERASCQANGIYFAVRDGCSVQTLRNLLDVIQDLKHVENHHSLVGLNPNDELPELVLFDVMSSRKNNQV